MLSEARALVETQKNAHAAQLQASSDYQFSANNAEDYYTEQTILARKALAKSPEAINQLGLTGKKKVTFEGWTSDARAFYSNALANPLILAALAKFSSTEDVLNAGIVLIDDAESLQEVHREKMGLAQVETQARNAKIDQLEGWKSEVITCARLAFKDDPQQLEILGIVVYSPGYVSQSSDDEGETEEPVDPPVDPPVEPPVG